MLADYLRELQKVAILAPEEEWDLWVRYRDHGDGESRCRLIEAYQPLVFKVVMQLRLAESWIMDMIQEGTLGLIEAVERFDYTRGIRFSTFATYRIRGRVLNALRRERADVLSLEHVEGELSLAERLADASADEDLGAVEDAVMMASVARVVETLPPRERKIIEATYLEAREPRTVARELAISLSHFYRLQKQALQQVREALLGIAAPDLVPGSTPTRALGK
ncbi:MAG: sigma-70 family RNA polymerase sigma factor [Armatimonadetes bacterium]|nr:sigma-70 family RNA polymerase sigma factor [Armatimonadota bacterium]